MEFRDGRIQGFQLKFKKLGEDTERYALLELSEAGKIQQIPGKSLYTTHYDEGHAWIMDCYFEKRLFDQLEDYFTPQADDLFSPFYPATRQYLDRMLEMGESARVRRIWRAKVFEATLANPDDFDVSLHHGESGGMDTLRDGAPTAYEWREAKAMKPVKAPLLELKGPEIEEEAFASALPKVAAAMGVAD
jgi:hypothetical protein